MRKFSSLSVAHIIPWIFVVLWSTGFISAKYALPYIEPFYLLFIRALLALALFSVLLLIWRPAWPGRREAMVQLLVGSLVHAAYLGGVFAAIKADMPAGLTSMLVGLQPLLSALLVWLLWAQPLTARQWGGLGLGLLGITLILWRDDQFSGVSPEALAAALLALLGITLGTLCQKRWAGEVNLISGAWLQYLAMAFWMALASFGFENQQADWQLPLVLSLAWLVLALSLAATLLLMLMIRQGAAEKVAGYFYLVPPLTALEAWWLFDEQLTAMAMIGIGIAVFGVYLVIAQPVRMLRWRNLLAARQPGSQAARQPGS